MAQQLIAFTALPEDPSLIPAPMVAQNHPQLSVTTVPEDPIPSFDLLRQKLHIHKIKKINKSQLRRSALQAASASPEQGSVSAAALARWGVAGRGHTYPLWPGSTLSP